MVFPFFVFLHLIATCAAIGAIVVTDMRLVAKLAGYRVVIPRPSHFDAREPSATQQHYGCRISDLRAGGAADRRGHRP